MAKRIDEATKLKINELYYEIGVKCQVAKILGISASSVSKYIIPGWKPEEKRNIKRFDGGVAGPDKFIEELQSSSNPQEFLWNCRLLSAEEWIELEKLQEDEV